jgi:TctA family transporter
MPSIVCDMASHGAIGYNGTPIFRPRKRDNVYALIIMIIFLGVVYMVCQQILELPEKFLRMLLIVSCLIVFVMLLEALGVYRIHNFG